MGRKELLGLAREYKQAINIAEEKKPEALLFTIDGELGKIYGTAAYYPDTDILRIDTGNGEIKIPGAAVHSLKLIFNKLDGE
jgi:hypothetical protein